MNPEKCGTTEKKLFMSVIKKNQNNQNLSTKILEYVMNYY